MPLPALLDASRLSEWVFQWPHAQDLDVTKTLTEHRRRDPRRLEGAVAEALPTLRRVYSFLRADAGIPHLRLLPEHWQLDVLSRLFALHPEPSPRSRELLVRWLWRTFLGATRQNEQTVRRRGVAGIGHDEEPSIQRLLSTVERRTETALDLAAPFNARTAASRLSMLAVCSRRPVDFRTGRPLDVAALLEEHEAKAFTQLTSTRGNVPSHARTAANRTPHPVAGRTADLSAEITACIESRGVDDSRLRSHLIEPAAAEAWQRGAIEHCLELRAAALGEALDALGQRMAAWDHGDRPSIDFLLRELEPAS